MKAQLNDNMFIYSDDENDIESNNFDWFDMEDFSNPNCKFVMNNKEFRDKLNKGEITIIDKNQLTIFDV